MGICIECGNGKARKSYKYCSNKCQHDYQYKNYIYSWKKNKVNGTRGINTKGISRHVRRYLFHKFTDACSACRWSKKHPVTGLVPLEIDHIDGNSENNAEDNLRLLCPNCHSLTEGFRNLNVGKGREWRRLKYIKSTI